MPGRGRPRKVPQLSDSDFVGSRQQATGLEDGATENDLSVVGTDIVSDHCANCPRVDPSTSPSRHQVPGLVDTRIKPSMRMRGSDLKETCVRANSSSENSASAAVPVTRRSPRKAVPSFSKEAICQVSTVPFDLAPGNSNLKRGASSQTSVTCSSPRKKALCTDGGKGCVSIIQNPLAQAKAFSSVDCVKPSAAVTRTSPRKCAARSEKEIARVETVLNPLILGGSASKEECIQSPPTPDSQTPLLSPVSKCFEHPVMGRPPPTPPKRSASPISGPKPESSFLVGDVVWARAVGYPWWPAMLIYEPDTGRFCDSKNRLHVQFFGEKVERAWATGNSTRPFLSKDDIPTFKDACSGKSRHSVTIQRSWILAGEQAEEAMKLDRFTRRGRFTCAFTQPPPKSSPVKSLPSTSCEVTKNLSVSDPLGRKRAHTDDMSPVHPSKKAKILSTTIPDDSSSSICIPALDDSATITSDQVAAKGKKPRSSGKHWLHQLHVCLVCGDGAKPDDMMVCTGGCGGQFHLECLGLCAIPSEFMCDECTTGISSCGVCRGNSGVLKSCASSGCSKQYHIDCLLNFASTKWLSKTRFICPLHSCQSCSGRDGRMDRCARCPTVFHSSAECLQAGYRRLNDTSIICLRHQSLPQPIHLQYCYECGHTGTDRLNCGYCPQSIEPTCLPNAKDGGPSVSIGSSPGNSTEGSDDKVSAEAQPTKSLGKKSAPKWVCSDCRSGTSLHFGDIVHCKIGMYRWWPSKIVHEDEIPENLVRKQPGVGHFLVYFYGSGDYAWSNRGRTIPFNGKHDMPRKGGKFSDAYAAGFAAAREEWSNRKKAMKPYEHVKTNVASVAVLKAGAYRKQPVQECMCSSDNPCSASSGCLNFAAHYECDRSNCPAGEACQNHRMQQRKGRRLKVISEGDKGYGVRCHEDIPAGEFVIEYCGEVMLEDEFRKRLDEFLDEGEDACFYFMRLGSGLFIDAARKGNTARFINHSCSPNLYTEQWVVQGRPHIGLFAMKDIKKGDELSFDYQLDYCGLDRFTKCLCGAPNCSGFLGVRPKNSKPDKMDKKKKKKPVKKAKKPRPKKREASEWEDDCFECGEEEGDLVMCDYPNCPKVYHLACLKVNKVPHGSWWCPYHVCDECSAKAVQFCAFCSSSCCRRHPDVLRAYSSSSMMCSRHDEFDTLPARSCL